MQVSKSQKLFTIIPLEKKVACVISKERAIGSAIGALVFIGAFVIAVKKALIGGLGTFLSRKPPQTVEERPPIITSYMTPIEKIMCVSKK